MSDIPRTTPRSTAEYIHTFEPLLDADEAAASLPQDSCSSFNTAHKSRISS